MFKMRQEETIQNTKTDTAETGNQSATAKNNRSPEKNFDGSDDDGSLNKVSSAADDHDFDDDNPVATADMCHYCFDTLLKKLLPKHPPSALGPTAMESGSPKRRWMKKSASERGEDKNITSGGKNKDEKTEINSKRKNLGSSSFEINSTKPFSPPKVECPLFVTWDKRRSSKAILSRISSGMATPVSSNFTDDENSSHINSPLPSSHDIADDSDFDLRGCIGTLAPRPLHHALGEFAIVSALKDRRFEPISLQELPLLRVGVSLLVRYEECLHCHDWEVGVHGIIIQFVCPRGREFSATYLPEVAFEQRWNQEEAVISLIRKAGYRGAIHDDLICQIQCTRYQSSKHRLTYQDYVISKCNGVDPLSSIDVVTAVAADEAMRQRLKAAKPCVNL